MLRTQALGSMSAFQDNIDQYAQDICHIIYLVYIPDKTYLIECLRHILCLGTECQSNPQELTETNTKGQGTIPKCCALRILHVPLILKEDSHNAEVIMVCFSYLAIVSEVSLPMQQQYSSSRFCGEMCLFTATVLQLTHAA